MPGYSIKRPSTRRPLQRQNLTLAAVTISLVLATPGANQVLLVGDALVVTTTASNFVLRLPANTGVAAADIVVELDVICPGNNPVALVVQDSAGTVVGRVQPGQTGHIMHGTAGPMMAGYSAAPLATGDIDPITGRQFITVAAGAGNTDVAASKFTRAWRLTPEISFVSGGATGGTIQVKTAAGASAVSDAMVPGNANAITRAVSLENSSFAAASGLRIVAGAGNPGGTVHLQWIPA